MPGTEDVAGPEASETGSTGSQSVAPARIKSLTGPIGDLGGRNSLASEVSEVWTKELSPKAQNEFIKGSVLLDYERRLDHSQEQVIRLQSELDVSRQNVADRDVVIAKRDGYIEKLRAEISHFRGAKIRMRIQGFIGAAIATFGVEAVQKAGGQALGAFAFIAGCVVLYLSWPQSSAKEDSE
jgi:hypothetical protein